jgi:LacI family transcriptional regulator
VPSKPIEGRPHKRKRNSKVRRVGYKDVARMAGVSPATVSYVLSPRSGVTISAATRRRVLDAASRLSYRHNELARCLVRGKTQTIGVLISMLDMTFHAGLITGIQQACLERDYRVLLGYSPDNPGIEQQQLDLLLRQQVEAIIVIPTYGTCMRLDRRFGETLADEQTPVIVLDHAVGGGRLDYVVSDDRTGATSVVAHLIERGHGRIAFLGTGKWSSPATDRYKSYRAAMLRAGLAIEPGMIFRGLVTPEDAAAAMAKALDAPEPPTAAFVASDYLVLGALQVIAARGLRIPQDIAVAGFSDAVFAPFLNLTTVRRSPIEMGKTATRRLLERIENPDLPPEGIVTPTELIVRQSTGAIL